MKFSNNAFLKRYTTGMNDCQIARELGVSSPSVWYRRTLLGLLPIKKITDDKFLHFYRKGLNDREIAEKVGVNLTTIWGLRNKLGLLPIKRKWTTKEVKTLKRNYGKISVNKIATLVNRTSHAVMDKANKLNLRKNERWTKLEIDTLKKYYGEIPTRLLAKKLNRSCRSIRSNAYLLGLSGRENGRKLTSLTIKAKWNDTDYRKRVSESHKGIKPCEKILQMFRNQKGSKHPNWRGGISYEPYTREFYLKAGLIRFLWGKCAYCGKGSNGRTLDIHHINQDKKDSRFSNLLLLHRRCHPYGYRKANLLEPFFNCLTVGLDEREVVNGG